MRCSFIGKGSQNLTREIIRAPSLTLLSVPYPWRYQKKSYTFWRMEGLDARWDTKTILASLVKKNTKQLGFVSCCKSVLSVSWVFVLCLCCCLALFLLYKELAHAKSSAGQSNTCQTLMLVIRIRLQITEGDRRRNESEGRIPTHVGVRTWPFTFTKGIYGSKIVQNIL